MNIFYKIPLGMEPVVVIVHVIEGQGILPS